MPALPQTEFGWPDERIWKAQQSEDFVGRETAQVSLPLQIRPGVHETLSITRGETGGICLGILRIQHSEPFAETQLMVRVYLQAGRGIRIEVFGEHPFPAAIRWRGKFCSIARGDQSRNQGFTAASVVCIVVGRCPGFQLRRTQVVTRPAARDADFSWTEESFLKLVVTPAQLL